MHPQASPAPAVIRRINLALFLAGFATFSLLYCVQPLLPLFAAEFGVRAAESSLALSLSTGFLAAAIMLAGAISAGFDRRRLMFGSMGTAALANLAASLLSGWHGVLLARGLVGLALGGVPAVAMAYLADRIPPQRLGASIGLYVAGTAFGGMMGRVGTSLLSDHLSWRWAMGLLSVLDLLAALGFLVLLPRAGGAPPVRSGHLSYHLRAWGHHLADPRLRLLFLCGGLGMGSFVTIYNYAGFHLMSPAFGLTQTHIGLIFTAYVFGIAASPWAGRLADRLGQAPVLTAGVLIAAAGAAATLSPRLLGVIVGIVLLTIGFFAAHSVASGWVGRTAQADKGHAASLYLLAYYLGSSVLGSWGGWFWEQGGWTALVAFTLVLQGLMLAAALALARREAAG